MSGGFDPWHTTSGGGGGGVTSIGPVGSTPNDNAGDIAAGVLTLEPADATHPGVVTALAQTFAGDKTWTGKQHVQADWFLENNGSGVSRFRLDSDPNEVLIRNNQAFAQQTANASNGDVYWNIDTTAKRAVTFPLNCGFTFPTTLAPSGTTQIIDWSSGSSQIVDSSGTTGTLVLTFSNSVSGGRYVMEAIGKTARIWTFPATVKWAGGVAPTVTATNGAIDMFEFYYDGTIYVGRVIAQNVS